MLFHHDFNIFIGLTGIFWILFLIYWLLAARKTKKTILQQNDWIKYFLLAAIAVGLLLQVIQMTSPQWLETRAVPDNLVANLGGVVICLAGLFLAAWARRILGQNWSSLATLKQEHELIQAGPYRLVRHPIYTGMIIALLGTAVTYGKWVGLIMVALSILGFLLKIKKEEALLLRQFPDQYMEYKQKVKRLIPFLF